MHRYCDGVQLFAKPFSINHIHVVASAVHRQKDHIDLLCNVRKDRIIVQGISGDIVILSFGEHDKAYGAVIGMICLNRGKSDITFRPDHPAVKLNIIMIAARFNTNIKNSRFQLLKLKNI